MLTNISAINVAHYFLAKANQEGDLIATAIPKKLSPDAIKLARQKIKQLSYEMNADRKRLIKDEQEVEKYKDDAYYKFLKMLDNA